MKLQQTTLIPVTKRGSRKKGFLRSDGKWYVYVWTVRGYQWQPVK